MDKGMRRKALAGLAMCLSLAYLGHVAWATFRPKPLVSMDAVAARLHIHDQASLAAVRARTLQEAVGGPLPNDVPQGTPSPPILGAKATLLPNGFLLEPEHGNGRLAIWHAGHDQTAVAEGSNAVRSMLAAGYDVLALNMPKGPHARFAREPHPLRPFIVPVAEAINYALSRKHYTDIQMWGLSGGGWTTVVYAALDPRITRSVPVAGSLPTLLRYEGEESDYEQTLPGLSASYLDLYLMASSEGREQVQVFNLHDPCCFSGTRGQLYEGLVADRAHRLGGRFGVVVVENYAHSLTNGLALLGL